MKRTLLLLLLCLTAGYAAAQKHYIVTGTAQDSKSGTPVDFASAVLLRADSTIVSTATTDENGAFRLTVNEAGNYRLRLSYIGFKTYLQPVTLSEETDSIGMGTLRMTSVERQLGTATVTATASRVEQKDDTTMFSASAYRVPTGSTLEALVKQLPGVEVDDNGTIKWNGKEVKEFLINGKDFFKGDTKTAMKNLPTELVSKIKAYDKRSDYAEQTGIDDGEETTVLDISTKRELNESWVTNVDAGYGNHDRYTGKVFATRFTDRTRVTVFGSANNTGDRGFGGPRGFNGGSGLTASKMAGLDFSWENDKKKREAGRLELGGSVYYNHRNNDLLSSSNSETFLTSGGKSSFSNSFTRSGSRSTSVNANFRLQWLPDSMTTITFRPSYSYSSSDNHANSRTATFNDDPYSIPGMTSPLDSIFATTVLQNNPALYAMMVNTNKRLSLGDNNSHNVSGTLNITRKLNSRGRNVSLNMRGSYSTTENHSFSISDIQYGQSSDRDASFLNQYSNNPSKQYSTSARLGYVEPLGKNWFAEARYQFRYRYSDSDRSRYNLDSLYHKFGLPGYEGITADDALFGDIDNYPLIGSLPTTDEVLNYVRDLNNSQYATYKYYDHTANVGVRYNSETIRFNAGVGLNPKTTKMAYNRPGQNIDTLITRKVFNLAPEVRFRYKFSKTDNLDINYRGSANQPSMTDLLAVVDDSNPLSISMGNPGLKPSWTNTLRIHFNGYNPDKQRGLMAGANFSQTNNSISNRLVYDEASGVSYLRPENINGNWNGRAMFMINSALGKEKAFNINSFTTISYSKEVGYVSRSNSGRMAVKGYESNLIPLADGDNKPADRTYDYYNDIFKNALAEKNNTRTTRVSEHLRLSYRKLWYDLELIGRVDYQHARASVQDRANMDTWTFDYGANANFNFDFGLSISTDIRMSSRRGYADANMNTNELVWNAQIAQSFLRKKNATLSLQFYDILKQQSNISRSLSATSRTDSWTNAINSYFMVHFIYKLNIFPGGSSGEEKGNPKNGERPGPPNMRGRGGMPAMPMHAMPMRY